MDSSSGGQSDNYRLRGIWARRRSGSASYSTATDTTINTPTSPSFPAETSLGDSGTAINTPTSSHFGTEASGRSPDSRRDRRHSSSSSNSSISRRPTRQPYECSSCRRYRLLWRLIPVVFCIICIIGAPTFIPLLQNSNWSKSKQGILSGLDSPWPGSTYIITEGDSTKALTFTDNGNVKLTRYRNGDVNQIWTCYEADGWLSFGHTTSYGSTVYLGYKPWPSDATLHCDAPSVRFNEQFEARSRPRGGFQLQLRNGYGLEPLGWSGGRLSRVRRGGSGVWWRFTKVQNPNPLIDVLPVLGDISLVVRNISLRILEECWQLFLLVLGFVLKTLLNMF